MPEIFATIRGVVDKNRKPGRFIILGSASGELMQQSSESLAGRIGFLELPPWHNNIKKELLNLLKYIFATVAFCTLY